MNHEEARRDARGAATERQGRLLRRREVEAVTGLPRSTLYLKIAEGEFPRPVRLGKRAVAWREADVLDWIAQRPTACEV